MNTVFTLRALCVVPDSTMLTSTPTVHTYLLAAVSHVGVSPGDVSTSNAGSTSQ